MKTRRYFYNSLFYASVASLGGFLFGYHTASISGALIFISETFNLTIFQQSFLVSTVIFGALIGSWFGGTIADLTGRRNTFFIAIYALFIGTFSFVTYKNLYVFYTSRALVGFAVGIFSAVVPIYIAELSKPKYRGKLVSINHLFLVLGILISNIFGYFFSKTQNWEFMFLTGLFFALLMFLLLFFIPETPSYLASRNRTEEAYNALKKITDDLNHTEVVKKIESHKKIGWKDLLSKQVKAAFIVGIGINIFRQVTGINIVTYYAPKIFLMAGFNSPHIAMLGAISVTSANLLATIVSLWLIDYVGRKPLLIFGISGMVISLTTLGIMFLFSPENLSYLIIIPLMLFTASFATGLGGVSFLINSEIFPMEIRGRAVGITTLANWICNYLVSSSFLSLIYNFGKSPTFFLFGAIGLLGLLFVIKKVPETKGKSFLEIQKFFSK
ncbi:MAG: sugar porter family MFS transporter [Parachlamydiales bacterium]|jgi:sugar porter (SP) family MFS transporter